MGKCSNALLIININRKKDCVRRQFYFDFKVMCVSDMKTIDREKEILDKLIDSAKFNVNVVQVKKVITDQSQKLMVVIMERCESNLQKEWEQRNKIYSNEQAKDVLKQLLNGYKILFDQNILHRDLKPENILVNQFQGKPLYKLADFGVGKVYKKNDFQMTKTGTPVYAAPEINQLVSDPTLSDDLKCNNVLKSNVDIFSIGIILFQLLFGKIPFETTMTGIQAFFKNLKYNEFKIPQDQCFNKDPQLIQNIEQMLKYYPSQRITFDKIYSQYLGVQLVKPVPKKFITPVQKVQSSAQGQIPQSNFPPKQNPNFNGNQNIYQPQQNNVFPNQQNQPQNYGYQQFQAQQPNQQYQPSFQPQQQFQGQFQGQQQPVFRQGTQTRSDILLEDFKKILQFLNELKPILNNSYVQLIDQCLDKINRGSNRDELKQCLLQLRRSFSYNKSQLCSDQYVNFYFALIYYTEDKNFDATNMNVFEKRQFLSKFFQ